MRGKKNQSQNKATSSRRLGADTIIAICSMIIALLAVCVSIWDRIETREHNRKSVTPSLFIYRDLSVESENIGFYFESTGTGPAIVSQIIVSVDGKNYDITSGDSWIRVFEALGINRPWTRWTVKSKFVPAGRTDFLFTASRARMSQEDILLFTDATDKVTIRIDYSSVYGDRFTAIWSVR